MSQLTQMQLTSDRTWCRCGHVTPKVWGLKIFLLHRVICFSIVDVTLQEISLSIGAIATCLEEMHLESTYPDAVNVKAVCGAGLVTLPPKFGRVTPKTTNHPQSQLLMSQKSSADDRRKSRSRMGLWLLASRRPTTYQEAVHFMASFIANVITQPSKFSRVTPKASKILQSQVLIHLAPSIVDVQSQVLMCKSRLLMSKSSVDAAPQEIPLSIGAMATCLEEIHIDRHLHLVDPPDTIVSRGTKQLIGDLPQP